MISSEVQRTLVKSPPELWAELSDPESLARHLGELGEIRITRVEPEELVEWEAENRTGKVQIKASGWGTRVTLTVDSEGHEACLSGTQPAAEHDAGSSDDDSPQTDPSQTDSSQAEQPAPPADSTDLADGSQTPAGAAPSRAWQHMAEPVGHIDGDPTWPGEGDPDVEPAAGMEQEPGGELQAQPAEADHQLASAEAETPDEEPDDWLADEALEPRRGFFARLFGRGLRPRAFASAPSDVLSPIQASLAPDVELTSEDPGPEALEPPRDGHPHDASEPTLEAQAPEIEQGSEIAPQPEAEAEPETGSGSPSATALQSPAAGAEGTAAPAEDAAPEPQAQDISAELKATEETAAAHVTAVLTSVLDRLGAAHHRPFSRS